ESDQALPGRGVPGPVASEQVVRLVSLIHCPAWPPSVPLDQRTTSSYRTVRGTTARTLRARPSPNLGTPCPPGASALALLLKGDGPGPSTWESRSRRQAPQKRKDVGHGQGNPCVGMGYRGRSVPRPCPRGRVRDVLPAVQGAGPDPRQARLGVRGS